MNLERRPPTGRATRRMTRRATRTAATRTPGIVLLIALAGLALLANGCAKTDRDVYAPGDAGQTTFRNLLRHIPLWLGGCNVFVQERFVESGWVDEGGELVCVWEGFASPVAPRGARNDRFITREPGTWRLSYDVGLDCTPDQSLSEDHCERLMKYVSNEFIVAAVDDHETFCTATGGEWNIAFCGNLFCGQPNACLALIPGCDCGPDANFFDGVGCVEDPACAGDPAQALCEDTGGVWDPLSCGHYSCGAPPICAAVIPGCNCGPSSVFVEGVGCLAAPCGVPQ